MVIFSRDAWSVLEYRGNSDLGWLVRGRFCVAATRSGRLSLALASVFALCRVTGTAENGTLCTSAPPHVLAAPAPSQSSAPLMTTYNHLPQTN
jgi:hypothetical protein